MMKYIKLFENRFSDSEKLKSGLREKFKRVINYKYLEPEERDKVLELTISFMNDKKIIENINELTYQDFCDDYFNYLEVWTDSFSKRDYINIYQFIDTFHLGSTPAVRNTLTDILEELYVANNIEDKLDQQAIKVLEKEPKKYKKRFELDGDYFTSVVTNACKWMLDFKKYNL